MPDKPQPPLANKLWWRWGEGGGPLAGEVGWTPSREEEAMGMGDRPPSYSASNSMVAFILSK